MVKLYEGCWGKRRDGVVVGPFKLYFGGVYDFFDTDGKLYMSDGGSWVDDEYVLHIVKVYPSDPRIDKNDSLDLSAEQRFSESEFLVSEGKQPMFNLTTREQWRWWFAGQALCGLAGNSAYSLMENKKITLDALLQADALIEQLEKCEIDE